MVSHALLDMSSHLHSVHSYANLSFQLFVLFVAVESRFKFGLYLSLSLVVIGLVRSVNDFVVMGLVRSMNDLELVDLSHHRSNSIQN